MTILVYHSGALGDFVTVLPLLRLLLRRQPDSELAFLGRRVHGELGRAARYFSETWDLDSARYAGLFADRPHALPPELARPDAAVAFAADDSPVVRALLSRPLAFFLHHPPFPSSRTHVVDYHLGLLDDTPLGDEDRWPSLRLQPGLRAEDLHRTVALHPGSGSLKKNWPIERFEGLAERLAARGLEPLWVSGPVEEEAGVQVPDQGRVARLPDLCDLASTLAGCALYVGNDSGVSHLAAAAGCPTVALFGPTDPAVWAPRGPEVSVVRSRSRAMDGISVDEAAEACGVMLGGME